MARLYTHHEFTYEDQTETEKGQPGDGPWSVKVRVPSIADMDQLAELIPDPMSLEDVTRHPEFAGFVEEIKKHGEMPSEAELLANLPPTMLIEVQAKATEAEAKIDALAVAAVVRKYASEPKNLLDDAGHELTWGQIAEASEPYYRACMIKIAKDIVKAVRGTGPRAAEKNSPSSSAS